MNEGVLKESKKAVEEELPIMSRQGAYQKEREEVSGRGDGGCADVKEASRRQGD